MTETAAIIATLSAPELALMLRSGWTLPTSQPRRRERMAEAADWARRHGVEWCHVLETQARLTAIREARAAKRKREEESLIGASKARRRWRHEVAA